MLYDAVQARVDSRRKDFAVAPDDLVRTDAIVEMRNMLWTVRDMQTNLAWLDGACDPVVDLGTRYYVERLARDTIDRDVEITVIATERFSYATTSEPWRPVISDWGGTVPRGEPTVVVVLIPRREQHSGLLHPLIAHELGHAIDSRHGNVRAIIRIAASRRRITDRFGRTAVALARERGIRAASAGDHLLARLQSWVAEVFCDAVAVRRLGPTYLYSFLAEVAAGDMDQPGPHHPPPRERIALLMAWLESAGWRDVIKEADPPLQAWVDDMLTQRARYVGAEQFLVWAVQSLRAAVYRHAGLALNRWSFLPNQSELTEVRHLLHSGIPPAQLRSGEPAQAETIMLACWLDALATAGGGPSALGRAPDAPQLAELLPAALELSALLGAWRTP